MSTFEWVISGEGALLVLFLAGIFYRVGAIMESVNYYLSRLRQAVDEIHDWTEEANARAAQEAALVE